eukprot:4747951-Pyramimonas_sp.AAC.1
MMSDAILSVPTPENELPIVTSRFVMHLRARSMPSVELARARASAHHANDLSTLPTMISGYLPLGVHRSGIGDERRLNMCSHSV